MLLVPQDEWSDTLWFEVKELIYDPALAEHLGVDPSLVPAKPDLPTFYQNYSAAHANNRAHLWAMVGAEDKFLGYAGLNKLVLGEWEISTIVADPRRRSSGLGFRAGLKTLKWAFEEDEAEWVFATVPPDHDVRSMAIRCGFRPFGSVVLMDRPAWNKRWAGRIR